MGITVFINLEGIHNDLAQRVIDYTSGACVAIDGNFQKVSNMVFVATPRGVAITGDMMDLLGESVNNYDY
jgi:cell division inhibitor SepF